MKWIITIIVMFVMLALLPAQKADFTYTVRDKQLTCIHGSVTITRIERTAAQYSFYYTQSKYCRGEVLVAACGHHDIALYNTWAFEEPECRPTKRIKPVTAHGK